MKKSNLQELKPGFKSPAKQRRYSFRIDPADDGFSSKELRTALPHQNQSLIGSWFLRLVGANKLTNCPTPEPVKATFVRESNAARNQKSLIVFKQTDPARILIALAFVALFFVAVVAMPELLVALMLYAFAILLLLVFICGPEWLLDLVIDTLKLTFGAKNSNF